MTRLVIAAAVVAGIAAYLMAGWHFAMRQLPRSWATGRKNWTSAENIRSSVRQQTACIFLFWPLLMIFRAGSARMDAAIDKGDPVALAAKLAERDRYIARLEREAGIRS